MSIQPTDRCCIVGEGSSGHLANILLQDLIRFQKLVWKLSGKEPPKTEAELDSIADHVIELILKGKKYELSGLRDVPSPFMDSTGQFMSKIGDEWKVLDVADTKKQLLPAMLEEFKQEDAFDLTESPYKELKGYVEAQNDEEHVSIPDPKDVVLYRCEDKVNDKLYDLQAGNKTIFNLASQVVTSFTNGSDRRIEAALNILNGVHEIEIQTEDENISSNKRARFLVRLSNDDDNVVWDQLSPIQAAEFLVIFVFEVYLEKGVYSLPASGMVHGIDTEKSVPPSTEPVSEPTDYDVLFGRGGMTNGHSGNRRFRDIIALHRPDYIRAIKMDKPGVARKIVRAIRMGNPPGRFLKKGEDGKWYDVGDRTAAEKTSQGLRERTNAEKRQRSALREALRIRRQDFAEDGTEPSPKKTKASEGAKNVSSLPTITSPILNYVSASLGAPLSLNMKEPPKNTVKRDKIRQGTDELNTEGLPPNAVDEDGNILVTDYDILCGRGGLTNHHKGNKRFRDIVALHRPDYVRAPKIQKPSVARVIVRAIRNGDPPGRFLRKDEKSGKWIDIGDKKAAEKTSQALREKSNDERDEGRQDPSSHGVGVLLPNPSQYLAAATAGLIAGVSESGVKVDSKQREDNEQNETSDNREGKAKNNEKEGTDESTAEV